MGDKRIFWATKKLEIAPSENKTPDFDVSKLIIYENTSELPSQQAKQTGEGEQLDDGRVSAG